MFILGLSLIIFIRSTLSHELFSEVRKRGVTLAREIARESVDFILTENTLNLQLLLGSHMDDYDDLAYIFVLDPEGNILAHTFDDGFPVELREINTVKPGEQFTAKEFRTEMGGIMDVAAPILPGSAAEVHTGIAVKRLRNEVSGIIQKLVMITVFVLIAGAAGAFAFASILTRPISELTKAVKSAERGDFGHKVDIRSNDEMGKLGRAFNRMTDEIQQNQNALKASIANTEAEKAKTEAIVSAIGDGISIQGPDFRILYQNEIHKQYVGAHAGELCYEAFENRSEVCDGCPVAATYADGSINTIERAVNRENGISYLEITASSLRNSVGEVVAGIEVVRDITARKEMELHRQNYTSILERYAADLDQKIEELEGMDKALRESEQRFRTLVENSPMGILQDTVEGKTVYVNDAMCSLLEVEHPEEVCGNSWRPFFTENSLDIIDREHNKRVHGISSNYEAEIIGKKGGRRNVLVHAAPLMSDKAELLGTIAFFHDITERKTAEEELLRLRELLGNVINFMPSILVVVDTECRITLWNREAEEGRNPSGGDIRGQLLGMAFPALGVAEEKVQQALSNRIIVRDERFSLRVGDELRNFDMTVYPLISRELDGAVVIFHDVTDHIRMQEVVAQSEKMLSVGGLAAGMAHEINNPLAGIIQNVQVMKNRVSDEIEKNRSVAAECGITLGALRKYFESREIFQIMDAILESGHKASFIVNNVLTFSGKSGLRFVSCDLKRLADRTLSLAMSDYDLRKKFGFTGVEVIREYHEALPAVQCEESQVQQVLLNLIKNCAQAMAEKEYRGEKPVLRIGLAPEGSMVRVEISDNGPGMEESVRKRVFEPFYSTWEMNAGLGLSISYFIITQNHRGTIEVESSPGTGTKIVIRIPQQRSAS